MGTILLGCFPSLVGLLSYSSPAPLGIASWETASLGRRQGGSFINADNGSEFLGQIIFSLCFEILEITRHPLEVLQV